jgi:hypothetical protein
VAPRLTLLAAALCLSGCGATVGNLPEWAGGVPASAPQRPAENMPFPNVYEQRPQRDSKTLSEDEQKRLESELSNLRDAQNKRAIPPPAAELKASTKDATKGPTKTAGKPPPKAKPKKVAEKPKPKAPEKKKPEDSLVPAQKAPSDFRLMN